MPTEDADLESDGRPFLTDRESLAAVYERITSSVESLVTEAGADGVVVAMSGGVDSTLTATLAADAVGGENVLALGMPYHKTEQAGMVDARAVAENREIDFREIHLRSLIDAFDESISPALEPDRESLSRPNQRNHALGNVAARMRMVTLYYAANRQSRIVLGTANRSESLLGYFTKYGDGAADWYPIGDLYKTEVRALADYLDVPDRIIDKEPTAGFYVGQTDADELGAPYAVIDPLLERVVDRGQSLEHAADEMGIDRDTAREVLGMYDSSKHKRTILQTPGIGDGKRL
ncbi:NAD+ synthase [Halostagnicola kamekurae]|uniref:NH(3)-dependent NAD(+) synthetase n=1 Tax=Halostagnicola kamekurae TaxID=619731 RepID=A0A1I6RIY1_9EURY|nr:NAD+ synthase [Halostagnicola kamekurae]SFS64689.1 NH(3)-dependent NAD(+) synthetase [Halostagnicola kamekurae]